MTSPKCETSKKIQKKLYDMYVTTPAGRISHCGRLTREGYNWYKVDIDLTLNVLARDKREAEVGVVTQLVGLGRGLNILNSRAIAVCETPKEAVKHEK